MAVQTAQGVNNVIQAIMQGGKIRLAFLSTEGKTMLRKSAVHMASLAMVVALIAGHAQHAQPVSGQTAQPNPCVVGGSARAQAAGKPAMSPDVIAALPPDEKKALLECLTQASAQGNVIAIAQMGEQYRAGNGIVPRDYQKAFEYTRRAVDGGNTRALTTLGDMYMNGQGTEKDQAEGMKLYLMAADSGDMKAPRYLGVNYELGHGTPIDYAKAAHYYQIAAEKNDTTGQCLLGSLYERGIGVEQSYDKATEWYTKSAVRGDIISSPGMAAMGSLYETRNDGKQDTHIAIEWYKKAADLKNHEAQADLARLTGIDPKVATAARNVCLTIFEQTCDLPTTAACKQ